MKNKGELVIDALRAMRDVCGGPNNDSWRRTLVITGDNCYPDTPARAVGTAWVLDAFDPKQDLCPLIHELVIYKGFVIYRDATYPKGQDSARMTHRKALSCFLEECWPGLFKRD